MMTGRKTTTGWRIFSLLCRKPIERRARKRERAWLGREAWS